MRNEECPPARSRISDFGFRIYRPPGDVLIPSEAEGRAEEAPRCHPDRGPEGSERRDLWARQWRASAQPAP
jgi:hypothetical protein